MSRSRDHSIAIYHLAKGYNLDVVRTSGTYDVIDPVGLAAGSYFVTVLEFQNARPGNMIVRQTAVSATDGSSQGRTFDGNSWSSWASIGSGGGGSMTGAAIIAAIDASLSKTSWHGNEYNVLDYGADPTGAADSTPAIQAALDAAKNAGGGVVRAPKGLYKITYQGSTALGGVRIGDNTTLIGDGMGVTTFKLADIGNNDIAGVVRTYSGVENKNIVIRDLTVDGNKGGQTGWANVIVMYFGVTPDDRVHSDKDIWCINVEAMNGKNGTAGSANLTRGYGFDPHEVVDRFHAINCRAHDNERDGFVLDGVINFKLIGNHSYNNGRYGINLITMSFNGLVSGNHVHDNGSNGVTVQAQSYNMVIDANHIYDNGEQGVRVRRGSPAVVTGYPAVINTYCKITNNLIRNSGKSGINITGSCYNTISDNTIINSSQLTNNTYFDVSVDQDDGDTGTFTGAMYNVFSNNYAVCEAGVANKAKAAYREDLTGALPLGNVYMWNKASGQNQGAYSTISTACKVYDFSNTYINALDYGIVADGTDQWAKIKAMTDAVADAGGGAIYFPTGVYDIAPGGTTSQGCLLLSSNMTLIGDGPGKTVLRLRAGANVVAGVNGIVRNTGGVANVNVSILGLTIDGNKAGQNVGVAGSCQGLYLGGVSDDSHFVVNVEVKNCFNGIGTSGYGVRLTGTTCANHRLVDVAAHDNDRDGFYVDGVTGVRFRSCRAETNGRNGFLIDGGSHDIALLDCEGKSSATNNFLVQNDSYDVRVIGGVNSGATTEGFRIRRGTTRTSTNVRVIGMLHTLNMRDGVKLSGACDNEILDCRFLNNGQQTTNTYSDVVLLQDTTTPGSTANNNRIANCTMTATGVPAVKYSINEVSVADGDANGFVFNRTSGYATAAFNIFGATSFRADETTSTPGGNIGTFQYKVAAGQFAGPAQFYFDTVNSRPAATNGLSLEGFAINTPPSTAVGDATGFLHTQYRNGSKFVDPAYFDPIGRVRILQSRLHGRNVSYALARNATTTTEMDFFGIQMAISTATAWTTTRTASAAANASTKLGTIRRVGYNGSAVAGNGAAYVANSVNYVTRGSAAGVGGFLYSTVFVVQTRSAGSRAFFGLANFASAATVPWFGAGNVASGTDLIGVGWDIGDSTLSWYYNDNVSTATKVTIGGSAPADGKAYELIIACKPNDGVLYALLRDIATGTEYPLMATTDLPRNNVFLAPFYGMYNGADAVAMSFGVANLYIDQDL